MNEYLAIIATAVLTTIGTFGVNFFGHRATVRRDADAERKRRANYLAIRVVCCLDPFVTQCCDVATDEGALAIEGERHPVEPEPSLSFPEDVDWQSVEPSLMYRALALPNELARAKSAISWVGSEHTSPPDHDEYFEERWKRYSELGLAALALANEFRAAFDIPALDDRGWSIEDDLRGVLAKLDRREKQRAENNARMIGQMEERRALT